MSRRLSPAPRSRRTTLSTVSPRRRTALRSSPISRSSFRPGFYVGAWLSNVDFGDDTELARNGSLHRLPRDDRRRQLRCQVLPLLLRRDRLLLRRDRGHRRVPDLRACSWEARATTPTSTATTPSRPGWASSCRASSCCRASTRPTRSRTRGTSASRATSPNTIWADLRYYDASYADPTTVVSLNWDTDWESVFAEK